MAVKILKAERASASEMSAKTSTRSAARASFTSLTTSDRMPLKDLLLLSDEGSVCHPSNSVTGTPATLVGRRSVTGEVMRNLANMTGAFKND